MNTPETDLRRRFPSPELDLDGVARHIDEITDSIKLTPPSERSSTPPRPAWSLLGSEPSPRSSTPPRPARQSERAASSSQLRAASSRLSFFRLGRELDELRRDVGGPYDDGPRRALFDADAERREAEERATALASELADARGESLAALDAADAAVAAAALDAERRVAASVRAAEEAAERRVARALADAELRAAASDRAAAAARAAENRAVAALQDVLARQEARRVEAERRSVAAVDDVPAREDASLAEAERAFAAVEDVLAREEAVAAEAERRSVAAVVLAREERRRGNVAGRPWLAACVVAQLWLALPLGVAALAFLAGPGAESIRIAH